MSAKHHSFGLTFAARSRLPSCSPLASYLLQLMTIKQTNLCVSADVTTTAELLKIAEELGDSICVLKTHADIVGDFSERSAALLREVAMRKRFLVFEDRKFADIGSTVQKQYTAGPLAIAKWAEIVTTHLFPGPAILTALEQAAAQTISQYNTTVHTEILGGVGGPSEEIEESSRSGWKQGRKMSIVSISTTISTRSEPMSPPPSSTQHPEMAESLENLGPIPYLRAALVLAQMSSKGNFFTDDYTAKCVAVARQHREFTLGFISQTSLNSEPEDNFLIFTPGVKLLEPGADAGDGLGQQYRSPEQVIIEDGADVVIVGRGILGAANRVEMAERYRAESWAAYEARVS